MSLLPGDAGYLELVQAYFLAFRGDGLTLSPLDAELLAGWQARGIPYNVVCRAIRKTAEQRLRDARPGEGRLRTLRACSPTVEREFKRFEGMSAGRAVEGAEAKGPEHFARERLKKARAALRKAEREAAGAAVRRGLEAALRLLEVEESSPRAVAALLARADDALALVFVRALPFPERAALCREARTLAGPKPEGASPAARKDALRAHLVAVARTRGGLVNLA